jgi:hypothetical protein
LRSSDALKKVAVLVSRSSFPKGFRVRQFGVGGKKLETSEIRSPAKLNRWILSFLKVHRTNSGKNFKV